jgi:asparaginyl-tRNA synthetase
MQVIVDASIAPLQQLTPTGTSILVEGELTKPPEGTKQKVEFKASKILEVGPCNPSTYPIAKTRLPLEYLRNHLHLRSRTNTVEVFIGYT